MAAAIRERGRIRRREFEPEVELEEWVPFVEGEVPWEQARADAGGTEKE